MLLVAGAASSEALISSQNHTAGVDKHLTQLERCEVEQLEGMMELLVTQGNRPSLRTDDTRARAVAGRARTDDDLREPEEENCGDWSRTHPWTCPDVPLDAGPCRPSDGACIGSQRNVNTVGGPPGQLSNLSVFHSKSIFYGALLYGHAGRL